MARILIIALGSHGDVHPMVALAQTLRARGHDVFFATNPHFFPLLTRVALPSLPLLTEQQFLEGLQHPDLWHPTRATTYIFRTLIAPTIPATYQMIADLRPDLVVGTPLSLGARVAHDKFAVPYATVNTAPAIFFSLENPGTYPGFYPWYPRFLYRLLIGMADAMVDRAILPVLNPFRASVGLPPVRHVLTEYWHAPQLALGIFPEWFLAPTCRKPADWPAQTRLADFPLYDESQLLPTPSSMLATESSSFSPALAEFLAAGPPPVVFTPGSAMTQGQAFFRASAEAIRTLNARAIFLTRHPDQLPPEVPTLDPAHPRASLPTALGTSRASSPIAHFPFVPLGQLLPHAAALVSHGGIGTISQALAAGIPQLIMPMAHDQPDNAARLTRLGVALTIPPRRYSADHLARLLHQLLTNPVYRQAALAIAPRLNAAQARTRAAEILETLLPSAT